MKKIISIILTAVMLLCLIPFSASAEPGEVTLTLEPNDNTFGYGDSFFIWALVSDGSGSLDNIDPAYYNADIKYTSKRKSDGEIVYTLTRNDWFSDFKPGCLSHGWGGTVGSYFIVGNDTEAGSYTFRGEINIGGKTISDEFDFYYTGRNNALPHTLSINSVNLNDYGFSVCGKLLSEDSLPVQYENVICEVIHDGEVIGTDKYCHTNSKGDIESDVYIDTDNLTEGVYKVRVRCSDNPGVYDEYDYSYIKTPIVITVTTDKESYDYYNSVVYTVSFTNEEGTTEGLDWLNTAERFVSLKDKYGDEITRRFFYGNGKYVFTDNILLDVPRDRAGMLELTVSADEYESSVFFNYTGRFVPCADQDHVWGDDYKSYKNGHCKICSVCGSKSEIEPHILPDEWSKAEYVDGAPCYFMYRKCELCDMHEAQEGIHPNGHFTEKTEKKDPSCTESGYSIKYVYCDDCENLVSIISTDIDALGHDFDEDGVCTRCGLIKRAPDECPHEYTTWRQISWGCAEVCGECGTMLTDEYEHDCSYTDNTEGCGEARYSETACGRCGAVTGYKLVYNLMHHYVDGVCTECGQNRPPLSDKAALILTPTDGTQFGYSDGVSLSTEIISLDGDGEPDEEWKNCPVVARITNSNGEIAAEYMLNDGLGQFSSGVGYYMDNQDLPEGDYFYSLEIYRVKSDAEDPESFTVKEILYDEVPFHYIGYFDTNPAAVDLDLQTEADSNGIGYTVNVFLHDENGNPSQNTHLIIELLYNDEVIDVCDYLTNGRGKAKHYEFLNYNNYDDGTYTFRVTLESDKSVTDSVSFEYVKPVFAEPVITVAFDKDTYHYYEDFTATFTLKNEDGTTDNLDWFVPFSGYVYAVSSEGETWYICDFDFFENNGFTFTVNGKFDIPREYGYAGDCTVIIYLRPYYGDDAFTGTTTVTYTAELVPCEGEHDFEYVDGWYEGHFQRCRKCGFETETEKHIIPDEYETSYFGDEEPYCYEKFKRCALCGYVLESEVFHDENKLERVERCNDPTCEESGQYDTYTRCDNCGYTFDYEYTELPPLGHEFVDGICTRCGKARDCIAALTLDKTKAGENELITAVYTLTDTEGKPIAGAAVTPYCTLYEYYETSAMGRNVTTDENGQARFYIRPQCVEGIDMQMYPGEYYLSVKADDYDSSYTVQSFEFEDRVVDLGEYTVKMQVSEKLIGYDQVTWYNCTVKDKDGNPMPAIIVFFHTYYNQGNNQFSYWWITREDGVTAMGIQFADDGSGEDLGIHNVVADVSGISDEASYTVTKDGGFVPGDITGDGVTNNKDVVALFRYVSGGDVDISVPALDVNGDNQVNNKDVVMLFKYVSGGDVELSDTPYTPAA